MKIIERTTYLDKLKRLNGTPDIKVITGVRRSGKSKLMDSYIDWIKDNEKSANIIYINYTDLKYESLKEYHALNEYIESRYVRGKNNYLFVDEVQLCPDFKLTINSLHNSGKYDIYVTGSNAFLLSSDLATLFTGRTYEIEVFPFSFAEFMEYYQMKDTDKAFEQYLKDGGMAGSYVYRGQEEKYNYIEDIFDTLIVRDIQQKYKIRNTALMDWVAYFLMDNISNLSSARKIADTLTKNKDTINHKTVSRYMKYLCNAYAFYKVRRYDIRGKKYLSSSEKYYLSDHAFRYAKLGTKNMDYGGIIENVVAIELMRRGYDIFTGVLYEKQIDFVAMKHDEKIYIQVSDDISEETAFKREVTPLLKIKDAYPRVLIARSRHEKYQYEGIKIVDVAEWMLENQSGYVPN